MNQGTGAPWWLTISLPLVTAAATHFLTIWREEIKGNRDWSGRWNVGAKALVVKISDAAVSHYIDADAVSKTSVSAALIISDIRRLRHCISESSCKNSGDAKRTADAMRYFDETITSQDDFQDIRRSARPSGTAILQTIRSAEQAMFDILVLPRRPRKQ